MSLITDNQRESAQEPKPTPPPAPKPVRLQEYDLQPEFEQGQGELGFATEEQLGGTSEPAPETMEAGTYVEFAAGQPEARTGTVVEPGQGYLTGLQGQLGQSLPEIPLPAASSASTPPLTNLWKDATVDLGIPNLGDSRLTTATYPALYSTPFRSFDPGVGNTFVQGANASAQAEAQAQQQQQAARARAIQEAQQRRGTLPNTPDASKPWNEQLWGWASDILQGDSKAQQEANAGKVDVLHGRFGKYGAGLGGYFKSVFGVPIAAATALALETWGKDEYRMQKRLLRAGNPTVRTESADRRSSIEKPFNSLSAEEQHNYLTEVVSNRLPLNLGSQIRINADLRKGFGDALLQAVSGQVDDSVSDPNPRLAPVKDQRTGQLAKVEPPKGLFYARNKRPGQGFLEDPGSAAIEIFAQLASPGNKIDFAGEALGIGLRAIARTNAAKATGRAIVNAVPQPIKQGVGAVANVAKRTATGVATGTFGQKPVAAAISQPTPVVGVLKNPSLPRNTGAEFEAYLRNQQNGAAVVKPPVVPDVPAFDPTTTPVLPKTDPEGLAAVVGIGQKGQPLTFEPTVGLRTHEELVQQVLSQNPEKFGSYRGTTWAEWDAWKKANLSEEDVRQLEAVGAVQELMPPRVQKPATLDDLQTQARVLAEQKLSVEAPLKQLEEVFDETVDVGRRTVDDVPLRTLTEADVVKALDYEASLRLSRQLPPALVQAAASGDTRTFLAQAEAFGGIPGLVQAHNQALTDLSSRVTPEVVAKARLASEVPPVVYHGTALAQWQPYNVIETGSRGELGSALYTTRSYDEAAEYSRATVGNNRPTEIAYEPLAPQVVALDTSKLVAPLDARATLDDDTVRSIFRAIEAETTTAYDYKKNPFDPNDDLDNYTDVWGDNLTYVDAIRIAEIKAAEVGGGEQVLKRVNDSVADVIRSSGYDSIYDPKSGWLAVLDNGKLSVVKQEYVPEPSAVQAAVARYNADSLAAGHYPSHVTSDANLRDSSFQVLDQARNQLDERLEEVQEALQEATYKEEPKPFVQEATATSFDTLRARAKEPPSVERYKRDIQEFGQPLHPVLVREYATDKFEVIGNVEAYEAALASYNPRTYSMVAAMVEPPKQRVAGMERSSGYYLVDIRAINKRSLSKTPVATTKEEVIGQYNKQVPAYTTAPVVLEQTSFGTFRILDRGYTANAYKSLYNKGERGAEMVPSIVVDKSGKAEFFLVDLSAIEKKPKSLTPEVPKLEEAIAELERKQGVVQVDYIERASQNASSAEKRGFSAIKLESELGVSTSKQVLERQAYKQALSEGKTLTYEQHYKGTLADLQLKTKKDLEAIAKANDVPADSVEALATKLAQKASEQDLKQLREIGKGKTKAQLIERILEAKTNDVGKTIDTQFGTLVVQPQYESKATSLFKSVEQKLASLGLPATPVRQIVFVDTQVNAKALQKLVGAQDPVPVSEIIGSYSAKLDSLVINAERSLDELEPVIVHELMHVFESRLPDEAFDEFRKYIESSTLKNFSPSDYGLMDKGEFMAETAVAVLFSKNKLTRAMPDDLRQQFVQAWQQAALSVQTTRQQPYERLTELLDAMVVDKMPTFAKEVADVEKSSRELRQMLDEMKQTLPPLETTAQLKEKAAPYDVKKTAIDLLNYAKDARFTSNMGWEGMAQSLGARLNETEQYLAGADYLLKNFDFSQDSVGYANSLFTQPTALAAASRTLGVDLEQMLLKHATQVVDTTVVKEPKAIAAILKKFSKKDIQKSPFLKYATDSLDGNRASALEELNKAISDLLAKKSTKEYVEAFSKGANNTAPEPLNTFDMDAEAIEDLSFSVRNKAYAAARDAAPNATALDNLATALDDLYLNVGDLSRLQKVQQLAKEVGEDVSSITKADFGEALLSNPHATLTDALDEAAAGKYDICDL